MEADTGIHNTYREFVATRTYSVRFKHSELGEVVRQVSVGSEEGARAWFEQEYGTKNGHALISIVRGSVH
jgi:hypothetical protein